MRIRIDFAYDGTEFSGWARQPGLRTVQGVLESGLAVILRHPVALTVAGRTDAGVHARGAVAHADISRSAWETLPGRGDLPPARAAVRRLRGVLPDDVVVRAVGEAADGFDARFSALSRKYFYRLCDVPELLDPWRRRDTVMLGKGHGGAGGAGLLQVDAMNEAAQSLLGLHDFAAFCKARAGASTIRTLQHFEFERGPVPVVTGFLQADAFCHSMVRALMGALVAVGLGRVPVGEPRRWLDERVRNGRYTVLPAQGLCLDAVEYPPDELLAARAVEARARRDE